MQGYFSIEKLKILYYAPNLQAGGDKGLFLHTANGDCKLLDIRCFTSVIHKDFSYLYKKKKTNNKTNPQLEKVSFNPKANTWVL